MAETPAAAPPPAAERLQGALLHGTCVAPGLALGVCVRKDHELLRAQPQRVPQDRVEGELNRFHRALEASHAQLSDLERRLAGKVPAEHVRILDTHIAYLKDSVFLTDVENLILDEQMSLEAAIAKVISDFDRIFRLVENELLRDRAVDLRDVGIRVLRNLELQTGAGRRRAETPREYVLVARQLSIVDMFGLEDERVLGIVTEEGGLASHAAILARSLAIPTLTGVEGLLEEVHDGDFVILDATEGVVRVRPDERVRAQYERVREGEEDVRAPGRIEWPLTTADGHRVGLSASCGNLPEVQGARAAGLPRIGLYRTELLYLLGRQQPSLDALTAHYAAVLEHAPEGTVTFRLLHADSGLGLTWLHEEREPDPALGKAGVRALLEQEEVLRRQLQALRRAARGRGGVRVAVPFVVDLAELRRVREVLFEERRLAASAGQPVEEELELGVVIETPAAALGARELAREADFLLLSLDALQQYLMSAARGQLDLRSYFEPLHPVVLRTVRQVVRAAEELGRELTVFGVSALGHTNLPLLLGAGLRELCVPPAGLGELAARVQSLELEAARRHSEAAARAASQGDV